MQEMSNRASVECTRDCCGRFAFRQRRGVETNHAHLRALSHLDRRIDRQVVGRAVDFPLSTTSVDKYVDERFNCAGPARCHALPVILVKY